MLQRIAQAVLANHPEIHVMVLLIDERPEEVTDMRRSIKAEVLASSSDRATGDHLKVAELALERARRHGGERART
jgi:transcription termination factor Rho